MVSVSSQYICKSRNKPFYKIDLSLEHQNKEHKQLYTNCNLSLQERDKIFWLHVLLLNALRKIRFSINYIIVDKKKQVLS